MSRNKIKFRHSLVSAQVFGLPNSTGPLGFPNKVCDNYFNYERERIVDESLGIGKNLSDKWGVEFERRPRRKKRMAVENVRDASLLATNQMKRIMKGALDRLHKEMNNHFSRLFDIDVKFGFLLDVQRLCCSCDCGSLVSLCDNLASVYSDDLGGK